MNTDFGLASVHLRPPVVETPTVNEALLVPTFVENFFGGGT